jgi:hypothetical protein
VREVSAMKAKMSRTGLYYAGSRIVADEIKLMMNVKLAKGRSSQLPEILKV